MNGKMSLTALLFLVLQLFSVSFSQDSTPPPTEVNTQDLLLDDILPLFTMEMKEQNTESCLEQCQHVCQSNNPASCESAKASCDSQFQSYCQYSQDPQSSEYCQTTNSCEEEFFRCNSTTQVEFYVCYDSCIALCPGAETHLAKRREDPNKKRTVMTAADKAELMAAYNDMDAMKKSFMATSPCYKASYVKPVIVYAKCMDPDFYNNGIGGCSRSPHSFAWPSRAADCPPGYTNVGLLCHRPGQTFWKCCTFFWSPCPCPAGWTNTGCTCQIWPSTLGMDSMGCNWGAGEWKWGARCYRPCPPGYTNTGETCYRPLTTVGSHRMYCDSGMLLDRNTGFCYTPCAPGYYDVLGVCWSHCPSGTSDCGAFCAAAGTTCGQQIWKQVSSVLFVVGSLAAGVVSGGTSFAATASFSMAKNGALKAGKAILNGFNKAYSRYDNVATKYTQAQLAAEMGQTAYSTCSQARKTIELAQKTIDALSTFDPIGIVDLARAFALPLCPNLANDWEKFAIINAPPS